MAFSCTIGNHHYHQEDSECEGVFWSMTNRKKFQHAQWGHFSFSFQETERKERLLCDRNSALRMRQERQLNFISVHCLFVNNNLLQVSSRESHGKDIRHVTFQQTLLEVCIHDPQFLQICASTEWKWIETVPWQNKSYEEMLQIKLITEQSIISSHSCQPQNSV